MKIRNTELIDLDFMDADVVENCEKAIDKFSARANEKPKFEKANEYIRNQCYIVFDLIDEIFGEGAAYEVFEGKCNLNDCIQVAAEVVEKVTKSVQSQTDDLGKSFGQYSVNRADRRNNAYRQNKPRYNGYKGKK